MGELKGIGILMLVLAQTIITGRIIRYVASTIGRVIGISWLVDKFLDKIGMSVDKEI